METQDAIDIFTAAVKSVQPEVLLPAFLKMENEFIVIGEESFPVSSFRNIYVIGAGKAAAAMAAETEKIIGPYITDGIVVTKYHHAIPCKKIKVVEAAHPIPDEMCIHGVKQTLQLLEPVRKEDIVICLISGGASALWTDLPEGITLEDMKFTFDALLKSGAAIDEMNTVRKHLSGIKGGQLVRHCHGARVISLLISDVPGDKPEVIASGPSMADPSTFKDAFKVLEKYNLLSIIPAAVIHHIEQGINGIIDETPKPGDPVFDNCRHYIIGTNLVALKAAAKKAKELAYHVTLIGQLITGDCGEEAKNFVGNSIDYPGIRPACILQGGETTVRVSGGGKGGRNQHFVLCALKELVHNGNPANIFILSGGTDGTDGPTDAAGAVTSSNLLSIAVAEGLSMDDYINNNDSYQFFEKTGGLMITGPTQTNVMDIMIAIIK
jgi:glycerate 2-kinase